VRRKFLEGGGTEEVGEFPSFDADLRRMTADVTAETRREAEMYNDALAAARLRYDEAREAQERATDEATRYANAISDHVIGALADVAFRSRNLGEAIKATFIGILEDILREIAAQQLRRSLVSSFLSFIPAAPIAPFIDSPIGGGGDTRLTSTRVQIQPTGGGRRTIAPITHRSMIPTHLLSTNPLVQMADIYSDRENATRLALMQIEGTI
jgi:hypothetical protein